MKSEQIIHISEKPLTPAMEDYLEAIFNLSKEKRVVRVKDIAKRLGVKMPTVTNMLKTLSARGVVNYEKYEYLELTDKGAAIGADIVRRHRILRSFLINILSIDHEIANQEACKIEHGISPATLDRFVDFMEFVQNCPRTGPTWLEDFNEYCLNGSKRSDCLDRMKEFSSEFDQKIREMERAEAKNHGT